MKDDEVVKGDPETIPKVVGLSSLEGEDNL
jgi:hypothetical protein